jgi:hypothetical protein
MVRFEFKSHLKSNRIELFEKEIEKGKEKEKRSQPNHSPAYPSPPPPSWACFFSRIGHLRLHIGPACFHRPPRIGRLRLHIGPARFHRPPRIGLARFPSAAPRFPSASPSCASSSLFLALWPHLSAPPSSLFFPSPFLPRAPAARILRRALAPGPHVRTPVLPLKLNPKPSTPYPRRHTNPSHRRTPKLRTDPLLLGHGPTTPVLPSLGQDPQQLRLAARKLPEASTLDPEPCRARIEPRTAVGILLRSCDSSPLVVPGPP